MAGNATLYRESKSLSVGEKLQKKKDMALIRGIFERRQIDYIFAGGLTKLAPGRRKMIFGLVGLYLGSSQQLTGGRGIPINIGANGWHGIGMFFLRRRITVLHRAIGRYPFQRGLFFDKCLQCANCPSFGKLVMHREDNRLTVPR